MNDLEVKSEQQNHSFKMRQYYTVLVTNGIAGFRVCFIGIKCGCKKVGKEEKKPQTTERLSKVHLTDE